MTSYIMDCRSKEAERDQVVIRNKVDEDLFQGCSSCCCLRHMRLVVRQRSLPYSDPLGSVFARGSGSKKGRVYPGVCQSSCLRP